MKVSGAQMMGEKVFGVTSTSGKFEPRSLIMSQGRIRQLFPTLESIFHNCIDWRP